MYATKKRKKIMKQSRGTHPVHETAKSNPSKRHRERLNSELDHLASLLPYEQGIISKLDKLSVLRLAVNYLRTKSYFQVAIYDKVMKAHHLGYHEAAMLIHASSAGYRSLAGSVEMAPTGKGNMEVSTTTTTTTTATATTATGLSSSESTCMVKAEDILQALNGFLLVVTCDGEVFFASDSVEQYLGFHQSDIIHQSVMELIHSEDREQFKLQLYVRPSLNLAEVTSDHVTDAFLAFNQQFRRFTVRFRCLLDNTSGFITLEITGRLRVLHGQSLKSNSPKTLALFALCSPLGVLPSHEPQGQEMTFKTKHKMDMSPVSMDPRGKAIFGYTEKELSEKKGYDLIHYDDAGYYAAAHQELIKTGSSGLIAYRLLSKNFEWIWLQTSSKVVYKNSKPDYINCVHRHLTADEGNDLLGKRGSEFKLPYALIYDLSCKSVGDVRDQAKPTAPDGTSTSLRGRFCQREATDSNSGVEPDSLKVETPVSTSGSAVATTAPVLRPSSSLNRDGDSPDKSSDKSAQIHCSSTSQPEGKVISEAHSLNPRTGARTTSARPKKKVREHLKEYLQAGRRRKAPYREVSKSYDDRATKPASKSDSRTPCQDQDSSGDLVSAAGVPINSYKRDFHRSQHHHHQHHHHPTNGGLYESAYGFSHRHQSSGEDAYGFGRSFATGEEFLPYGQPPYYNYYQQHQHQNHQGHNHHPHHQQQQQQRYYGGQRDYSDQQVASFDHAVGTLLDYTRHPAQYDQNQSNRDDACSPSADHAFLDQTAAPHDGRLPLRNDSPPRGVRLYLDPSLHYPNHWRGRPYDFVPFVQNSSRLETQCFADQGPEQLCCRDSPEQDQRSLSHFPDTYLRHYGALAENLSKTSVSKQSSVLSHGDFGLPNSIFPIYQLPYFSATVQANLIFPGSNRYFTSRCRLSPAVGGIDGQGKRFPFYSRSVYGHPDEYLGPQERFRYDADAGLETMEGKGYHLENVAACHQEALAEQSYAHLLGPSDYEQGSSSRGYEGQNASSPPGDRAKQYPYDLACIQHPSRTAEIDYSDFANGSRSSTFEHFHGSETHVGHLEKDGGAANERRAPLQATGGFRDVEPRDVAKGRGPYDGGAVARSSPVVGRYAGSTGMESVQCDGLDSYHLCDLETIPGPNHDNHRSVIRLNNRHLQQQQQPQQQVHAVPVIRAV